MEKVKALLNRLGKPKATPTKETEKKPPLEDMEVDQEWSWNVEGVQGGEKVILRTSSYESLDSIDKETLRISKYRK